MQVIEIAVIPADARWYLTGSGLCSPPRLVASVLKLEKMECASAEQLNAAFVRQMKPYCVGKRNRGKRHVNVTNAGWVSQRADSYP